MRPIFGGDSQINSLGVRSKGRSIKYGDGNQIRLDLEGDLPRVDGNDVYIRTVCYCNLSAFSSDQEYIGDDSNQRKCLERGSNEVDLRCISRKFNAQVWGAIFLERDKDLESGNTGGRVRIGCPTEAYTRETIQMINFVDKRGHPVKVGLPNDVRINQCVLGGDFQPKAEEGRKIGKRIRKRFQESMFGS